MVDFKKVYTSVVDKYFQEKRRRMAVWAGLFFLIFLLILSSHFVPGRTNWEVGSVSSQDVQADRYLTFVDEAGTLARQQEALATFQDVYKIDLEKFNSITIASISDSFNRLEEIAAVNKGDTDVTTVDKIAQLHDVFEFTLGPDEWAALANLSETEIKWLYDKGIDYAIDVSSLET